MKKEMSYFNVVGGEGNMCYHLRVYLTSKFNILKEGLSFKFKNLSKKNEREFWVTKNTEVTYTSIVETDSDVAVPLLPEERPADGEKMSLEDALRSPEKSSVCGKIVKSSPLRYRQDGTLAVKSLLMKDAQSTAKVCLFGKNAESVYTTGDMLKVTQVYAKTWNKKAQLTSCPSTTCEFLPDDPQIEVHENDEEPVKFDPDFADDDVDEKPKEVTLTDFSDVVIYQCCDKEACRRKKLLNNKCPTCGSESGGKQTYMIHFLYETADKKDQKVTIFEQTFTNICCELIEYETKEDLITTIIGKLPLRIKASITSNGNFYNIQQAH